MTVVPALGFGNETTPTFLFRCRVIYGNSFSLHTTPAREAVWRGTVLSSTILISLEYEAACI